MSRGPGRWQRAALALLCKPEDELTFGVIAKAVSAESWSDRVALRRALDRLVVLGQLSKRPGKRMYGGARDIVWFRAAQASLWPEAPTQAAKKQKPAWPGYKPGVLWPSTGKPKPP
jgi:hypothetical protein